MVKNIADQEWAKKLKKKSKKYPISTWIAFSQERKEFYRSATPKLSSMKICKIVGDEWKQLDKAQKLEWDTRATELNNIITQISKKRSSNPSEEAEEIIGIKTELPLSFYQQDTVTVARELIGKVIEHTFEHGTIAAIINEAEAYTQDEASCHAFKGKSERNEAMFAEPGTIYLYYVYGQNICINFKTEYAGRGCAVLIRGCLPLRGNDLLVGGDKNKKKLLNGPAKLVKSMRIPMEYYGKSVLDNDSPIKIYDEGYKPIDMQITPRIGISQAKELPWRFLCKEVRKEISN